MELLFETRGARLHRCHRCPGGYILSRVIRRLLGPGFIKSSHFCMEVFRGHIATLVIQSSRLGHHGGRAVQISAKFWGREDQPRRRVEPGWSVGSGATKSPGTPRSSLERHRSFQRTCVKTRLSPRYVPDSNSLRIWIKFIFTCEVNIGKILLKRWWHWCKY